MMTNKFFASLVACLMALGVYAKPTPYAEERTVNPYSKIEVCCGVDLYITQATHTSLRVEVSDQDLLPKVKTTVVDNELRISVDFKAMKRATIKVYASVPDLTALTVGSGANVKVTNGLNVHQLSMRSSSSTIDMQVQADTLGVEASSGAAITLSGQAARATVQAGSGSSINMKGVVATTVDAKASSGASVALTVTEQINAQASSGGDIKYYGKPKQANNNTSSGGSVRGVE